MCSDRSRSSDLRGSRRRRGNIWPRRGSSWDHFPGILWGRAWDRARRGRKWRSKSFFCRSEISFEKDSLVLREILTCKIKMGSSVFEQWIPNVSLSAVPSGKLQINLKLITETLVKLIKISTRQVLSNRKYQEQRKMKHVLLNLLHIFKKCLKSIDIYCHVMTSSLHPLLYFKNKFSPVPFVRISWDENLRWSAMFQCSVPSWIPVPSCTWNKWAWHSRQDAPALWISQDSLSSFLADHSCRRTSPAKGPWKVRMLARRSCRPCRPNHSEVRLEGFLSLVLDKS